MVDFCSPPYTRTESRQRRAVAADGPAASPDWQGKPVQDDRVSLGEDEGMRSRRVSG